MSMFSKPEFGMFPLYGGARTILTLNSMHDLWISSIHNLMICFRGFHSKDYSNILTVLLGDYLPRLPAEKRLEQAKDCQYKGEHPKSQIWPAFLNGTPYRVYSHPVNLGVWDSYARNPPNDEQALPRKLP